MQKMVNPWIVIGVMLAIFLVVVLVPQSVWVFISLRF